MTVASGTAFQDAYAVRTLETTDDPVQARQLEALWIARLGSAAPFGYNLMPGGSSLGGPANSAEVVMNDPDLGTLRYSSASAAIRAVNDRRRQAGQRPLEAGTVYARLDQGWPPEKALELEPRVDQRGRRAAFIWKGKCYETLRAVSEAEAVPIATLRSRLHRSRVAGRCSSDDVAGDRRRSRSGGRQRGLSPVPDPDGNGGTVSLADFARRTGIPKATVTHRFWQLVRKGRQPETMASADILAALTCRQERRVILELEVGSGAVLTGGVRELIKCVLDTPAIEGRRHEVLGMSAIRRRLRTLPHWPTSVDPADVRWAFGFEDPERNRRS